MSTRHNKLDWKNTEPLPRVAFKILHTLIKLCKHFAMVAIPAMIKAARCISQQLSGESRFNYTNFLSATSLSGLDSHSCALSLIRSVETIIP